MGDWFTNNHERADTPSLPTLYVAGPMSNLPDHNYPAFNAAAIALRCRGHVVLNPVDAERDNPTPGTHQSWDWYMRRALAMLLRADAVAVLPGWEDSTGAQLEVRVANGLNMHVAPLAHWLEEQVA